MLLRELNRYSQYRYLSCLLRFEPSKRVFSTPHVLFINRCKSKGSGDDPLPDSFQILKPLKDTSSAGALRIKTISNAMKAYLERSKNHESFLQGKTEEFKIGRHHLANMLGVEEGSLTQEDIDKAIEYFLPSGLYEKKARPMMKEPLNMFPKEKAAQFDASGRPFSPFFYSRKSNLFETMHLLVEKFHELDAFEDKMILKGISEPPKEVALNLCGGDWISIDEVRSLFLENITEEDYTFLTNTLTRLANHPYSFRCKDSIWKFRKDFADMSAFETIPELLHDDNGRPYMVMIGLKKYCESKVTVRGNGTGKVNINDQDITYFHRLQDREQVMFPLQFTDTLGLVDIEVMVTGHGTTAQAGAIRHGLSLCLRSFVPPDFIEKMRLAGLLTQDRRRRGRKMPGQEGHRRKYTWKKR